MTISLLVKVFGNLFFRKKKSRDLESRTAKSENGPPGAVLGEPTVTVANAILPNPSPRQKGPYMPTADDEASAKLWSVYIDEARRYDEELLRGWKGDMDGMLLFSALYSASLTAFLIESYKTLQDDPAQDTVFFLAQISQQLAAASSGTTFQFEPPAFHVPTSAIVCNVLWFLSLALALTCSLLATFVQQWTRDFIHKTNLKPSPIRQARVIAYMYSGLRDFGMHSFVDLIPILLHISLFFFFAGLVVFLLPVNRVLTYIMACVLAVFLLVYMILSCIPLLYLNAPYRTPLSVALWRFGNAFSDFLVHKHSLLRRDQTLNEAMVGTALQDTAARDQQAVIYTMKSVTDDNELLPFLEAIPDAIYKTSTSVPDVEYDSSSSEWIRNDIRESNLPIFMLLLQTSDPEVNILDRLAQFAGNSGGWTDPVFADRSSKACFRALWSLIYALFKPSTDPHSQGLNLGNDYLQTYRDSIEYLWLCIRSYTFSEPSTIPHEYIPSVQAVMRISLLYSLRNVVYAIEDAFSGSSLMSASELRGQFALVLTTWQSILGYPSIAACSIEHDWPLSSLLSTLLITLRKGSVSPDPFNELICAKQSLADLVSDKVWQDAHLSALATYLCDVGSLMPKNLLPYEFRRTCQIILPDVEGTSTSFSITIPPSYIRDYAKPLLTLKTLLDGGSISISPNTDLYMIQCIKLFLSSKAALSGSPEAASGRRFVLEYCCQWKDVDDHGSHFPVLRNHREPSLNAFSTTLSLYVGECILKEVGVMDEDKLALRAALFLLKLTPRRMVRLWDTDFPLRLWKAIIRRGDGVDPGWPLEKDYLLLKANLDEILLQHICGPVRYSDHLGLNKEIQMRLIQEYLPHRVFLPPLPEDKPCTGSLWIALLVREVTLLSQEPTLEDESLWKWANWAGYLLQDVRSDMKVDEIVQLQFARSLSNLCDTIITQRAEHRGEYHLSRIYLSICQSLGLVCSWEWVTGHRGIRRLMKAILRIDEYIEAEAKRNTFSEMAFHYGHNPLIKRCQIVLAEQREKNRRRWMDKKKRSRFIAQKEKSQARRISSKCRVRIEEST
ncbi:hypothetical protein D9758_007113 [Tetrapyrgos nigripes]|uniref:DUF6535 domain-containing protein n=1 Tax=Tetrapyrgos nigripes TaxID=182062 RepID=A0A8H5GDC6_9AGAR|nr:hypothetical protein D9758_007113 [Tetrapyrgos nigripes]